MPTIPLRPSCVEIGIKNDKKVCSSRACWCSYKASFSAESLALIRQTLLSTAFWTDELGSTGLHYKAGRCFSLECELGEHEATESYNQSLSLLHFSI